MFDFTQYDLYNESKSSNYVLGFHGCYAEVAETLLSTDKPSFNPSENDYDWLGNGLYFWENDPYRAKQFIEEKIQRLKKKGSTGPKHRPAVIGAVLDLGYCGRE